MTREVKVKSVKTASLIPYARNARVHSETQVSQLAASIREFGWTNPILIDEENGVIAGHGRLMAAQKLGQEQVPVIELTGLTEAQKKAYILADNKLALNASWDSELLSIEVEELRAVGVDLELVGFSGGELEEILRDVWVSDLEAMGRIEATDSTAKGKLQITIEEKDREQIREAVTNLVDQLGLEGVTVG